MDNWLIWLGVGSVSLIMLGGIAAVFRPKSAKWYAQKVATQRPKYGADVWLAAAEAFATGQAHTHANAKSVLQKLSQQDVATERQWVSILERYAARIVQERQMQHTAHQ